MNERSDATNGVLPTRCRFGFHDWRWNHAYNEGGRTCHRCWEKAPRGPHTRFTPWQVRIAGIWWHLSFAPWSEWHRHDSETRLRRAWWWLCHWPSFGKYAIRVCGVTLEGRSDQPHKGWYGI